jgi:hypothetical protein
VGEKARPHLDSSSSFDGSLWISRIRRATGIFNITGKVVDFHSIFRLEFADGNEDAGPGFAGLVRGKGVGDET